MTDMTYGKITLQRGQRRHRQPQEKRTFAGMGNAKIPVYDCILIAVFILILSLFFTDYTIPPDLCCHECESAVVTDYYYIEEYPCGYFRPSIGIFDKQRGENYTLPVRYIDCVQRRMFGKWVWGDLKFAEKWLDLQSMPPLYLTVYNGEIVELKTDDGTFFDLETANWLNSEYRGGVIDSNLDFVFFGIILIVWFFGSALVHSIDRKASIKKTFR